MTETDRHDELSAYLDGELPPDERARMERDLASDASLRQELESLREVTRMLRRHGPADAPFGFHARVLEALADEPPPRVSWWVWLRRPLGVPVEALAVVAAAVMVVVVVGLRAPNDAVPELADFAPPPPVAGEVLTPPDRDAGMAQRVPAPSLVAEPQGRVTAPPPSPAPAPNVALEPPVKTAATARGMESGIAEDANMSANTEPIDVPSNTGTADDSRSAPALFGASYRYRVQASSTDAVALLLRLVGRYEGRVTDARGVQVSQAAPLTEARSLRVEIPARNLAAFGDALRALGLVEEMPDDRIFASSQVSIQVDLLPPSP